MKQRFGSFPENTNMIGRVSSRAAKKKMQLFSFRAGNLIKEVDDPSPHLEGD